MANSFAHAPALGQRPGYDVELAERENMPGVWTVEAIDHEGAIEQALFVGPKAHERAEAYRNFQYGFSA